MEGRGCKFSLIVAGIFVLFIADVTATTPTATVLWQFDRGNGVKKFGADLEAELGTLRIEEGDTVEFTWNEGTFHSLFEASDLSNYLSCSLTSGTRLVSVPSAANTVLVTPTLGTHYYFDDFQSTSLGCGSDGLRITIEVVEVGNLITTPAPTTPVPAVTTTIAAGQVAETITWHFEPSGQAATEIWIAANEQIRFQWDNSGIQHTLRQVDRVAYEECDEAAEGVDWSGPQTIGDVVVSNLEVGSQYFICYLPTHCSSGNMKLKVNVVPSDQPYYVTVWPTEESESTSDPVYISLVGHDDDSRLWVSPERQLNLQPVPTDLSQTENAVLDSSNPAIFEIYIRNVGYIDTIKLRGTGQSGWNAYKVNIVPTSGEEQSRTFACSGRAEDWSGTETLEQYCIAETIVDTPQVSSSQSANTTNATLPEDCQCFRQFLVHNPSERILICTTDGCFATVDNGQAGWGDINGITHLIGIGTDDMLYGVDPTNATVMSADGGVTWTALSGTTPTLSTPVLDYQFSDPEELPLDEHTAWSADNTVKWGVSSQGVHYNSNGEWIHHGLWACACDGACGLKCNQEGYGLYE